MAFAPWFAAWRLQHSLSAPSSRRNCRPSDLSVPLHLRPLSHWLPPLRRGGANSAEPRTESRVSTVVGRKAGSRACQNLGQRVRLKERYHLWNTVTVAANEATSVITILASARMEGRKLCLTHRGKATGRSPRPWRSPKGASSRIKLSKADTARSSQNSRVLWLLDRREDHPRKRGGLL